MNTKISYLYRDADNYKMHNKCVIAGTLTTEQTRTIKDCCEMGEYFIPRQVGLPERRFDRYDPTVDHCWFELDEDCFSETIEPPKADILFRTFWGPVTPQIPGSILQFHPNVTVICDMDASASLPL